MPSTGKPRLNKAGSICGAFGEKTLEGPPERMIPRAPVALIDSGEELNANISEYTLLSRTRRAMTWVYWDPKSRITTFDPSKACEVLIRGNEDLSHRLADRKDIQWVAQMS